MKPISSVLSILLSLISFTATGSGSNPGMRVSGPHHRLDGDRLEVKYTFDLDSMKLGANGQLYVSPVIENQEGDKVYLPTLLINGRNMHYAYERGTIKVSDARNYDIYDVVKHTYGVPRRVEYTADVPVQKWFLTGDAGIHIEVDTCGCGKQYAVGITEPVVLDLNPYRRMKLAYVTPEVTEAPVSIHEGRARVQFEVDRTELHSDVYVARNGQRIDNREQLKVIDDSISYAISDPNVEIANIKIVGYASPESPYLHNQELSTGRSRALVEYLTAKYNIAPERSEYDAVPENWGEFREIVEANEDITPQQRADLLALIDEPVTWPSDYDAKEKTLKTDRRFAQLYRSTILPKWFPTLRATEFEISTRLRPLDDEHLAEVMKKTPGLMTLNQMMRVARLYPEGSKEFNEAIEVARRYFPDDRVARLNAAIAAINRGEFDEGERLLDSADESPEAENARGVIATWRGDFNEAVRHFKAASSLNEARENLSQFGF